MLSEGEVVGGFVIKAPLGRGGMAAVYRAWDPGAGRDVALKLFDVAGGAEGLLRFKREAELAARVDGQGGVVRVHARGVHQGTPFMVLELVEGRDLAEVLAAGPIEPSRLARIVEEVARALAHCHALGVVHRDIKPANVLLRARDDAPLLTDFGIARDEVAVDRLTQTGVMLGTPQYMAPEQALDSSRATDPRVDVYALGAILYHGLAGRPPAHVISRVGHELPPPSSFARVDASLEAICLRAVAPEPEQRHPSATALADDLARWRGGERLVARRRRRWTLTIGLTVVALALFAGLGGHASGRRALARAERLDDEVLSALLVDPAATGSFSGGPAALVDAAQALAAWRPLLVGERRARADALVERLEACARLVDEHALPADPPPRDARARAADALVLARRSGASTAARQLGRDATRDPLVLAVEARLRAETSDALRTYVAWCATVKDEPLVWSVARPRVVALAARACREAVASPRALGLAEEVLAATARLEPLLAAAAIEDAVDVWFERMLQAARDPDGRETSVLASVRRLLDAGHAAPGPRLRAALFAVFTLLDARFAEHVFGVAEAKRAFDWDTATFELAPDAPPGYVTRLSGLARVDAARGLPLSFSVSCVRRGVELDSGYAWDDLGRAVLSAHSEPPPDPLARSGAVRLCALTAEVMTKSGKKLDSSAEPPLPELEPRLLEELVAGVDRVLSAPDLDVSQRYASELHVLAAEALLHLVPTRADASTTARAETMRAILPHVDAFMAAAPLVAELLWTVACLRDAGAAALERSGEERLQGLEPILTALRAAWQGAADEGRRRDLGNGLAMALQQVFKAAVAAGRLDEALAAAHESFDVVPAAPRGELRLSVFLSGLTAPADIETFAREFRDVAPTDGAFAFAVIRLDVTAGRLDEARALLEAARALDPDRPEWAQAEALLAAPR